MRHIYAVKCWNAENPIFDRLSLPAQLPYDQHNVDDLTVNESH
jgi:hypothetical protein